MQSPHSVWLSLALALGSSTSAWAGGSVVWDNDWEAALARAGAEKRVVFVAVNMDGEAANDRLAQKVYSDDRIVAASALTINVVASRFEHAPDKRPCPRFSGIECTHHRRIEGAVRQNVLKSDPKGYVVAPQHVFLGPDGKVLLSVPYEVTAEELQWCFAAALKSVDAESARKVPSTGRAPRRLIQGDVFDPAGLPGANLAPPTRAQVLELIKELKASMWSEDRAEKILRVLLSPEPEAVDFIGSELKNDLFGRRGWMAPMGDRADPKDLLMHSIGVFSPAPYAKLVVEYLDHDDEKLRHEAVVALEQLAVPDSVKAITLALGKEKKPAIRKDLMRALGSAGSRDEKARKTLLKAIASEKDELVRRNAIVALGWSEPTPETRKALTDLLASPNPEDRAAATVAAGLSRAELWIEVLEQALTSDGAAELKPYADAALQVLRGAALSALRTSVRSLCGDEHEREKFFGPASS